MRSISISNKNLVSLVLFLSILSSIYLFENEIISTLGMIFAMSALFLCALMFIANIRTFKFDYLLCIFLFIAVFCVFQLITYKRTEALYSIVQLLGFIILIITLGKSQISLKKWNAWKRYIRVIYYFIMIVYFCAFLIDKLTVLHEIISPTILKILFPLSWFAIKRNAQTTPIEILIFIIFHLLLGERTAAICMILVVIFQFLLKKMNHKASNILFWCVMVGAISVPFVYMWLYNNPIGETLNTYIYNYTGEFFFSGRNRIWNVIIEELSDDWIVGLGFGNTLFEEHGITLSTHNLYMYLYLNGGACLIALFALLMHSIWRKINQGTNYDTSVVAGKAYILGLLVFLDAELFLVANNVVISLIWWTTLAFIQMASRNEKNVLVKVDEQI